MRTLLLSLSVASLLAGCASMSNGDTVPMTPLARYSLQVEPGLDRIALAVHDEGLSANQQAALRDLAGRYARSGTGWVNVQGPSGDDPAASRLTWQVREALQSAGIPGDRIRVIGYDAPDPRAPVLAGFDTVRAVVPNCAGIPRDMNGRFSNEPSMGLGCAVNANLAAQIADPRDIMGPRAMTAADPGRAAVVFDHYRKGEQASAPQETLVEGRIARAVE